MSEKINTSELAGQALTTVSRLLLEQKTYIDELIAGDPEANTIDVNYVAYLARLTDLYMAISETHATWITRHEIDFDKVVIPRVYPIGKNSR